MASGQGHHWNDDWYDDKPIYINGLIGLLDKIVQITISFQMQFLGEGYEGKTRRLTTRSLASVFIL